jgi:8-oxo-dGTP pyrophosphatase MutT (NUDIX family)
MSAEEARRAATVMLLRDGPAGMEVLLLQRHGRSAFMPHMWVFPGGRVDDADHGAPTRGGEALLRLGWEPAGCFAAGVAAVRETFEESGVWLGDGAPDPALRSRPGDLLALGLSVDLDRLLPWARWITPHGEGRRFDTAFLVAVTSATEASHDEQETVGSRWIRPADALAAGFVALPLAPPTFWALHELAALGTLPAVLGAARDLRPVQPVRGVYNDRLTMFLPGDPGHPEPARPGLPQRLVLGDQQWEPSGV